MKKSEMLRELRSIETLIDNIEIVGRPSRRYVLESFKRLEKVINAIENDDIENDEPIKPQSGQLSLFDIE